MPLPYPPNLLYGEEYPPYPPPYPPRPDPYRLFMLLYGEYPGVAPNAVLFAAVKPTGREGNGGGADAEFVTAV